VKDSGSQRVGNLRAREWEGRQEEFIRLEDLEEGQGIVIKVGKLVFQTL
jgi:hypothetical protein